MPQLIIISSRAKILVLIFPDFLLILISSEFDSFDKITEFCLDLKKFLLYPYAIVILMLYFIGKFVNGGIFMKKFIIGLLAVLLFVPATTFAGYPNYNNPGQYQNNGQSKNYGQSNNYGQVNPDDKAVVSLLWLVYTDLQMCRASMTKSVMDNVSAIGHLNNSQSALRKAQVDPGYASLVGEIDKRIAKIKFYLVMNERRAVEMRIGQLMVIIRNVLGTSNNQMPGNGQYGTYGNNNNNNYNPFNNNSGYGNPNSSGMVPPVKPEIPVGGQNPGSSMPVFPTGVVPVR